MAPLQTHLILLGGWRFAYLVTACIVGAAAPVALLLKKHRTPESKRREEGAVRQSMRKEKRALGISGAFKTNAYWLFCLVFFAIGVSVQTVMAHIVAFSQSQGQTPMVAAGVLGSLTGASMVGRIIMGLASDRIGRQRTLVVCTFFEAIMLLWLMAISSAWALFVFGAVYGFFYGGHAPQLPALIGETFGFENMGAILGSVNVFWGIGSAIGPFATGYLYDATGSYMGGFGIATALIFTASMTSFFLKSAPT